jgi:hypothetical protein
MAGGKPIEQKNWNSLPETNAHIEQLHFKMKQGSENPCCAFDHGA